MTWNPEDRFFTDAELGEPDRRLDDLIAFIRSQNASTSTARWFIENLADTFGFPIVIGGRHPVRHFLRLSAATVWALHAAGREPGRRHALVEAAVDHAQEILSEMKFWIEEADPGGVIRKGGTVARATETPLPAPPFNR